MNWLFVETSFSLFKVQEPLVDCKTCQVHVPLVRSQVYHPETKCCEFTPFVSGFAVGAFLQENGEWPHFSQDFVYTLFGVMHPLSLRKSKNPVLCGFFDRKQKKCSIWPQRPATCATFFCASQKKEGSKSYSQIEDKLQALEVGLLKLWFDEKRLSEELWEHWGDYMEKDTSLRDLDSRLLFISKSDAFKHYRNLYFWLKTKKAQHWLKENKKYL